MDYLEAEMEARIFPSVDIDQLDLLEDLNDDDDGDERKPKRTKTGKPVSKLYAV